MLVIAALLAGGLGWVGFVERRKATVATAPLRGAVTLKTPGPASPGVVAPSSPLPVAYSGTYAAIESRKGGLVGTIGQRNEVM